MMSFSILSLAVLFVRFLFSWAFRSWVGGCGCRQDIRGATDLYLDDLAGHVVEDPDVPVPGGEQEGAARVEDEAGDGLAVQLAHLAGQLAWTRDR